MARESAAAESVQISVRVPQKLVDELDGLARSMSPPGVELSRADALRAVITRGMKELHAEIAKPPPPRKR